MEIVYTDRESIQHHGIKGQRWGVRRFQNEDGSLTPEGRERYLKYAEQNTGTLSRNELRKPVPGIISKGTSAYRISNMDEPIDSKRKYITVTEGDRQTYKEYANEGYFDYDNVGEHVYQFKKDIKVAKGQEVVDYVLEKYGDRSIEGSVVNDAYEVYKNTKDLPYVFDSEWYLKRRGVPEIDREVIQQVNKSYEDAVGTVTKALATSLFKNEAYSSDIFTHFAEKGYDAIVDAEDWFGMMTDYPLILLNPKESIEEISKKDLWD